MSIRVANTETSRSLPKISLQLHHAPQSRVKVAAFLSTVMSFGRLLRMVLVVAGIHTASARVVQPVSIVADAASLLGHDPLAHAHVLLLLGGRVCAYSQFCWAEGSGVQLRADYFKLSHIAVHRNDTSATRATVTKSG